MTDTVKTEDEREKEQFEIWFETNWRQNIKDFHSLERRRLMQMAWYAWQARAKEIE